MRAAELDHAVVIHAGELQDERGAVALRVAARRLRCGVVCVASTS